MQQIVMRELEARSPRWAVGGVGLIVVGGDGRVAYLDGPAVDLLDGRLAQGEVLPRLILDAGVTTLGGANGGPALELRASRASVDGANGWTIEVEDISDRREPDAKVAGILGVAGHELRTPITAVHGYATTMLENWERFSSDQIRDFVTVIERQSRRLGQMTHTLLKIASTATEGSEPNTEAVHLQTAMSEVVEVLGDRSVEVSVDVQDLSVLVDRVHLQEVVTNLVVNALKYGAAPIVVRAEGDGPWVHLHVTDRGPGVPEGFTGRMWDSFSRARAHERPAGEQGTGLGLALVRGLAEANGGVVSYRANVPSGSDFRLSLPKA